MDDGDPAAAPPSPGSPPSESVTTAVYSAAQELNERRLKVAERLFEGYDTDHSGTMELEEFIPLMQKYDTSVDAKAVKKTFEMAGGVEGTHHVSDDLDMTVCVSLPGVLTKEQFYDWVAMVFEDMSDAELEEICESLLQVTKASHACPDLFENRLTVYRL